jgi:hypothetical protein
LTLLEFQLKLIGFQLMQLYIRPFQAMQDTRYLRDFKATSCLTKSRCLNIVQGNEFM